MTNNKYLIYKHTSPNGKAYIGQSKDYAKRCLEHKKGNKCTIFAKAVKKYGWDNFKHEILKDSLNLEEANLWEKFYINHFNTLKPNGYNLRSGGQNSTLHESSKVKIGNANRGRICTDETRKKIAKANTGKKHSYETLVKISKGNKGKIITIEQRQILSDKTKKRMSNPDERERISKKLMNNKRSVESIEKSRKGLKENWAKRKISLNKDKYL